MTTLFNPDINRTPFDQEKFGDVLGEDALLGDSAEYTLAATPYEDPDRIAIADEIEIEQTDVDSGAEKLSLRDRALAAAVVGAAIFGLSAMGPESDSGDEVDRVRDFLHQIESENHMNTIQPGSAELDGQITLEMPADFQLPETVSLENSGHRD